MKNMIFGNKKNIEINYIRFDNIKCMADIAEFTRAKTYKYDGEDKRMEIFNGYEKVSIWLGGYVLMLHNKPVFLNERQFSAL